jgi:DNA replication protein DnaC
MSRETDLKLAKMAARLKLTLMRDNMEFMLRTVSEAKMTPRETLEYFFSKEIEQRESNRVKLALMAAHFPRICTLEGFDMQAQPSLDPGIIRELSKLEWIENGENVLFLGPPGVGKSHLAIALGRLAIQKGLSVLFISAVALMNSLDKAQREGTLTERIHVLSKPKLLIIDELGYLPIQPESAHLLFQLVCKRYESKSIIVTSNRPVSDWGLVFGDPTAATAILDRLLHHCTPVTILGDSYRIRASLKGKLLEKN